MKFFSQFQEDEFIVKYCERYRINLHPVAIEIGASNGLDLSNIRHFCIEKGFKGIYIEPHPERFKELLENTKGQNAVCINMACLRESDVDKSTLKVKFKLENNPDFSHISSIDGTYVDATWWNLLKIRVQWIGILSIDVEGNDTSILEDVTHSGDRPQFIIIESNATTERMKQVRILEQYGYVLHKMKDKNTLWMDGHLLTKDQDNAIYDVK
jgi:FkbM family methyltransferase